MDKDGLIILIGAFIIWSFVFTPFIVMVSESIKSYFKNLRNGNSH